MSNYPDVMNYSAVDYDDLPAGKAFPTWSQVWFMDYSSMSTDELKRVCDALQAAVKAVIDGDIDCDSKLALIRQVASANAQYCQRRLYELFAPTSSDP